MLFRSAPGGGGKEEGTRASAWPLRSPFLPRRLGSTSRPAGTWPQMDLWMMKQSEVSGLNPGSVYVGSRCAVLSVAVFLKQNIFIFGGKTKKKKKL